MKKVSLSLLLYVVSFGGVFAQAKYPLQKGNIWQYWTWNFLNGQYTYTYGWTDSVTADTLLSNGKVYALFKSDEVGPFNRNGSMMRQDSTRVFLYRPSFSSDSLLYDFGKSTGDTLWIEPFPVTHDTQFVIVIYDTMRTVFGALRRQWGFEVGFKNSTNYTFWEITDGIGLTYRQSEGGDEWFLRGATIDSVTYGQITSVDQNRTEPPQSFVLYQNYPNPFNPATTISFSIPHTSFVLLRVFDILGKEVAVLLRDRRDAGTYSVSWDASRMPSGFYIARLDAAGKSISQKMLLIK